LPDTTPQDGVNFESVNANVGSTVQIEELSADLTLANAGSAVRNINDAIQTSAGSGTHSLDPGVDVSGLTLIENKTLAQATAGLNGSIDTGAMSLFSELPNSDFASTTYNMVEQGREEALSSVSGATLNLNTKDIATGGSSVGVDGLTLLSEMSPPTQLTAPASPVPIETTLVAPLVMPLTNASSTALTMLADAISGDGPGLPDDGGAGADIARGSYGANGIGFFEYDVTALNASIVNDSGMGPTTLVSGSATALSLTIAGQTLQVPGNGTGGGGGVPTLPPVPVMPPSPAPAPAPTPAPPPTAPGPSPKDNYFFSLAKAVDSGVAGILSAGASDFAYFFEDANQAKSGLIFTVAENFSGFSAVVLKESPTFLFVPLQGVISHQTKDDTNMASINDVVDYKKLASEDFAESFSTNKFGDEQKFYAELATSSIDSGMGSFRIISDDLVARNGAGDSDTTANRPGGAQYGTVEAVEVALFGENQIATAFSSGIENMGPPTTLPSMDPAAYQEGGIVGALASFQPPPSNDPAKPEETFFGYVDAAVGFNSKSADALVEGGRVIGQSVADALTYGGEAGDGSPIPGVGNADRQDYGVIGYDAVVISENTNNLVNAVLDFETAVVEGGADVLRDMQTAFEKAQGDGSGPSPDQQFIAMAEEFDAMGVEQINGGVKTTRDLFVDANQAVSAIGADSFGALGSPTYQSVAERIDSATAGENVVSDRVIGSGQDGDKPEEATPVDDFNNGQLNVSLSSNDANAAPGQIAFDNNGAVDGGMTAGADFSRGLYAGENQTGFFNQSETSFMDKSFNLAEDFRSPEDFQKTFGSSDSNPLGPIGEPAADMSGGNIGYSSLRGFQVGETPEQNSAQDGLGAQTGNPDDYSAIVMSFSDASNSGGQGPNVFFDEGMGIYDYFHIGQNAASDATFGIIPAYNG
jgi:hypothetical protein